MFGCILARNKEMPDGGVQRTPPPPPPTYLASKSPTPCRVKITFFWFEKTANLILTFFKESQLKF